uniref:Secreted protein n=1 Tax=Steinernema glaseri TaxID=37863 RepID=A0A1I7YLH6_9BILA
MIATLLILTLCGFAVAFVRYRTRRNGQRALQRFRESYQLERPNMMNVHDREIAMLEAQIRETLDRASQVPRADQPVKIEAGPKDMAGVVGFLAQHQIEDEALEFRSTNPNVIIVPKCYQGVEPGVIQSSTFLSTELTGTTLLAVPTTLPATKSIPVHRTDAKLVDVPLDGTNWDNTSCSAYHSSGNKVDSCAPDRCKTSKLCTRKSKRGIAKPKKQNKASKADSSRKVNRRVGWSDSEQKHQVIAA